jgi:hypothetical protein
LPWIAWHTFCSSTCRLNERSVCMDVTKAPPFDLTSNRAGAGPTSQPSAATDSLANLAPLADRVDIQPLDTAAALQILIAEVRAELELPAEASTMQSPTQASRVLIQVFLQAVPEADSTPPDWASAVANVELTFRSALDRAVEVVERWRDVPQIVIDAVQETRALVTGQLSDGPSGPLWLRPEWLGLLPTIQAFRRRRRLARRGWIDPDSGPDRDDEPHETDRVADRDLRADDKPPGSC